MKLSFTCQMPRIAKARFRAELHRQLSEALAESCRVWLTTVIKESTSVGLPIWSAASIATLAPLASHVAYSLALIPAADAPNRVSFGLANGEADFEAGTQVAGLYTFTYYTTLPHLVINEYHNANTFGDQKTGKTFHLKNPGPYHFQEKGLAAFRAFASTLVLPGWRALLDVATIHIG